MNVEQAQKTVNQARQDFVFAQGKLAEFEALNTSDSLESAKARRETIVYLKNNVSDAESFLEASKTRLESANNDAALANASANQLKAREQVKRASKAADKADKALKSFADAINEIDLAAEAIRVYLPNDLGAKRLARPQTIAATVLAAPLTDGTFLAEFLGAPRPHANQRKTNLSELVNSLTSNI